jgi:hypothetical protein
MAKLKAAHMEQLLSCAPTRGGMFVFTFCFQTAPHAHELL